MDNFARLNDKDKSAYIAATANAKSLSSLIIEKDFWVCWTLKCLFESSIKESVIFKGGTSLSKVYNLIQRFSEDIDISLDKEILGFGGSKSPENAGSNKQMGKLIDALGEKCSEFICNDFKSELGRLIGERLPNNQSWSLDIDQADPSKQSLLFNYPKAVDDKTAGYIKQAVKMEFGARADQWPAQNHQIRPFIAEQFPDAMHIQTVGVRVLTAERTFWEKATILHYYAHYPDDKVVPVRQSRHFYDFYWLLSSPVKGSAETDLNLLDRVAVHKSIYFRAKWANYRTAKQGTLKLIPSNRVLRSMELDYKAMFEMFYGTVPTWREIVDSIRAFEASFNQG